MKKLYYDYKLIIKDNKITKYNMELYNNFNKIDFFNEKQILLLLYGIKYNCYNEILFIMSFESIEYDLNLLFNKIDNSSVYISDFELLLDLYKNIKNNNINIKKYIFENIQKIYKNNKLKFKNNYQIFLNLINLFKKDVIVHKNILYNIIYCYFHVYPDNYGYCINDKLYKYDGTYETLKINNKFNSFIFYVKHKIKNN
jgi:hypothetical protein